MTPFLSSPWTTLASIVALVAAAIFAGSTKRTVEVIIVPAAEVDARVLRKEVHISELRTNSAFFNLEVEVLTDGVHRVIPRLQSAHEPEFHEQAPIQVDDKGFGLGPVQLGSQQWPLTQDEDYAFDLK